MSSLIQFGMSVLSTAIDAVTSKILAQLGDDRGAADSDNAEWVQHVGFASRPSKVVPGKASAQVVCVKGGDRDVCIASQDMRGLELYGRLKEGETACYAAGADGLAQGRTLWKADGSITHFTKEGNIETGDSIYARVASGMDTRGIPDGFTWSGPWGTKKFDQTGFHVVHSSGACIDMGGIGLPAPLDVIGSYIKLKAATVSIQSTGMSHGDGVSPVDPLAKSTFVNAALASMQAQLTALATALTAVAANAAGPAAGAPAAAAPAAAAVAAGAAALPATVLLIPSTLSSA